MFLNTAAEAAVKARIASLEAASGVEVVTAVIARADSYPVLGHVPGRDLRQRRDLLHPARLAARRT